MRNFWLEALERLNWLTGILVLLTLTLTACVDSAPPPQISLIDRALVDTSDRNNWTLMIAFEFEQSSRLFSTAIPFSWAPIAAISMTPVICNARND